MSDSEYLSALETVTALQEFGAPIDLFVFPDEHHVKWQPAHRLAVYQRSLDWFDFWLRDVGHVRPERESEYARWRAWRDDVRPTAQ